MRSFHPRIYTHLVTLWLALSLGGIVLGIIVWRRLNESIDVSLRGASFHVAFQNTYGALLEAEAAAYRYASDGEEAELQRYRRALDSFERRSQALIHASTSTAPLRADVEALREAAAVHFASLERRVALRQGTVPALPDPAPAALRGAKVDLAEVVRRLEAYPEGILATHSHAARSELQRALSTTLAAGLFGLGAGVLAFYLSRVALRQETQKRELSEMALRAERASQDKSTFLANMSHEIRTPMNAILGFSELLVAELPPDGRSRKHAKSIHDAAHSLLQLINDILDLSKIEASMLELHREPMDLREVRSFLQTVFIQQATRKGLKLQFSIASSVPPALLVDRARLRQILVNLVSNAIKFTERGSVTVRVLWEQAEPNSGNGTLQLEVQDTGIGIPEEKRRQIFEPFVQVDTRRPFEQQGTGLGLSIVQRLAERMGGIVEVESEIGEGSTFRIRLPDVSLAGRAAAVPASSAVETVDFNAFLPSRILVVDDNATNRSLLENTFDGTHHRVRFATNGREAVEAVRDERPDVVLMDLRMPEMDGQTAFTEIQKLPNGVNVPVIAVTASSMLEDERQLRVHFAGYLRKPFTRALLFRQLAHVLPHRAPATSQPTPETASRPETDPETVLETARPEAWGPLIVQLRALEANRWRVVRDGGVISDARAFAHALSDLAEAHGCPPLGHYASLVLADAEAYAVHSLETRIQEFPTLIATLERRARDRDAATTDAPPGPSTA